ncbi:MAG: restriction endonuclease subunit S [Acidobacteriota bacterium]
MRKENGNEVDYSELPSLPKGWAWCLPADFCSVVASGSTPTADKMFEGAGDVPFIKVYNLTHSGMLDFSVRPTFIGRETHSGAQKRSIAKPGDVLINIVGPPLGKVSLVPNDFPEWNINQAIVLFRPHKGICNKYLAYAFLTHSIMKRLTRLAKATAGQFNIGVSMCRELFPVPIAPFNEQRRIVEQLDELFSDLDAGVAALERVQQKLVHYRAAVLKAAVEGALTAEWREQQQSSGAATEPASALLARILAERRRRWEREQLRKFAAAGKEPPKDWKAKYKEPVAPDTSKLPPLPEGWCWVSIDHLIREPLRNGHSSKTTNNHNGVPTFSLSAVTQGDFSSKNIKITAADPIKVRDLWVEPDDIFVQRSNTPELVGTTRRYKGEPRKAIFPDLLIRVRIAPPILPTFVELCLQSSHCHSYFRKKAQGISGSMPKIDQEVVQLTAIPLPPLAEQEAIIEIVEDQLSVIEHIAADVETKLKSAQALRQSILRHAFTGQLVPQDPRDEPAAELLKRIAAEREERAHQAQAARQSATKPKTERTKARRPRAARKKT